jgi:lipoate-protein ligase B
LQHRLVDERHRGTLEADTVLLLEHEPVFTLGHNGGRENLTVSEEVLKQKGIEVVETERGGNITYHGPGQIIAYPIIRMNDSRLGIPGYVEGLEEVMIRTASDWGIAAERNTLNHGVWVGRRKLGSVGIAIRRGVAFHGIALNVNLSLEPFSWINPCGLSGVAMTSLKEEEVRNLDIDLVRDGIVRHMATVFGVETVPVDSGEIKRQLRRPKGV